MIGRRSVWSDERVIELAKKFAATTDEVYRLQQDDDPEATFFQEMVKDGHYRGRKNYTQQGIYVCTPSGKLLSSINSSSPDYVLRVMQQGLDNWEKLSKEERSLANDSLIKPKHRWEDSYSEVGLDIVVFTRDLPRDGDAEKPAAVKWNQDRLWFSKSEAIDFLPDRISVGEEHELPKALTQRIVRFNFVDVVKGQTSAFNPEDIAHASFSTKIEKLEKNLVTLSLHGSSKSESRYEWGERNAYPHGVAVSQMGTAVYDKSLKEFVAFELVALGKRWGRTSFNDRNRDGPSNPIGFVFRLRETEMPIIAPASLAYYGADWIKTPE